MILFGLIPAVILFAYLLISSYFDFKDRKLPIWLMITGYSLICLGVILSIFHAINNTIYPLIVVSISIIILFLLMSGNAYMMKKEGTVFIGGADIVVFTAICCISPFILTIPTMVLIPAGALLLSTIVRCIPAVNRDFTKRGIPYIPFMGIIWIGIIGIPFLLGVN